MGGRRRFSRAANFWSRRRERRARFFIVLHCYRTGYWRRIDGIERLLFMQPHLSTFFPAFHKIPHDCQDLPRSVGLPGGQKSHGTDRMGKLTMFIKPKQLREHCINGCGNKPAGCGFSARRIFKLAHAMRGYGATCLTFPELAKLLD